MEQFGAYLKAQREKKGIRLEEIASITKIHLHSLELLESNQWDQLPPEPFIRGFIIAYAKYVGLDTKDTIQKYQQEMNIAIVEAIGTNGRAELPRDSDENANEIIQQVQAVPSMKILVAATVAAILVVLGTITYIGKKAVNPRTPTDTTAATKPPEKPASEVLNGVAAGTEAALSTSGNAGTPNATDPKDTRTVATNPDKATTPDAAPADVVPADAKHALVVESQERSWVKIVVDDKPPVELYLNPGEKANYWAKEKIKLVLGNATGSKVFHNGELASGALFEGTVRYYIFPANSRFPQDKSSKRSTAATPPSDHSSATSGTPTPTTDEKGGSNGEDE